MINIRIELGVSTALKRILDEKHKKETIMELNEIWERHIKNIGADFVYQHRLVKVKTKEIEVYFLHTS